MPANLPPEYFEAEKRFKEAATPQEKAVALEELISTVPKHKGTDKLRADLRKRLAQLREEAAKRKRSGKGDLYTIEKQGASQVALAGFANSGKSSILKSLTNANPVVADYPVSTVTPLSGMMPFEDIQFQLVDLPPIGNESTDGWVSGILRVADALLLVVDLSEDPDIQAELLIEQLAKWRIGLLKRSEPSGECSGCKPAVIAATRSDHSAAQEGLRKLRSTYETLYPVVPVSSATKEGLEELRRTLFEIPASSGSIRKSRARSLTGPHPLCFPWARPFSDSRRDDPQGFSEQPQIRLHLGIGEVRGPTGAEGLRPSRQGYRRIPPEVIGAALSIRERGALDRGSRLNPIFPLHPPEVSLEYLPEMETVDGKGHGHRQEFGSPEEGPEDEPPVVETLLSEHPQYEHGL